MNTRPLKTEKIKRVSMVDQVATELKQSIVNQKWKVGDCLPSEAELAKNFEVNRLTVRMALQKLNTIGLVSTKVGEGTFVSDFSLVAFLNEISDVYLDPDRMSEVMALRKLIEIECAKLACNKASGEEIADFEDTVKYYLEKKAKYQFFSAEEEDLDALTEADLEMHSKICAISHNHLFRDIFQLLRPLVKQQVRFQIKTRNALWQKTGRKTEEDQHLPLLEAIKLRDKAACLAAYVHLIDAISD